MIDETSTAAWTRIRSGATDSVVLAVDFDGSGRREATFRDLVKILPGDLEVWHAVTPPSEQLPDNAPQAYVDWWLQLPDGPGTTVRAILGYCAGSVFASALADALAARSRARPRVILFNPGRPTVDTLDRDFAGIVTSLTILDDAERDALREQARSARQRFDDDFARMCDQYLALYLRACATAFERFGIDPEVGGQLTGMFRGYVRYLLAAREAGYDPGWAAATALTAKEQAGSGFTDDETVFDFSRAELLRDGATAALAYRLLMSTELEAMSDEG